MKKWFLVLLLLINIFLTACPAEAKVVTKKDENGNWQLLVNGEPYFIKGMLYSPVKIGEDPNNASLRDWMYYDDDGDSINDVAYQTWIDANRNNYKDDNESAIGDFELLKQMGANTIRLYHIPSNDPSLGDIYKTNSGIEVQYDHSVNKELLRDLNNTFGIKAIMGSFLGSWTIGSGASWDEGTDYNNPTHRENIKKSVRAMVMDNKDEPYVLFWALGNENNMAEWSKCNAKQNPEVYAKFVNELAQMIHALDPNHPVAVIDGEDGYAMLKQYALHGKDIDIIGYNTYRSEVSFQIFIKEIRSIFDRPLYIAETGKYAYGRKGEDEKQQFDAIRNAWRTIVRSSAPYAENSLALKETGNAIGVTFFDWHDRWYMDRLPNKHNEGTRSWPGTDIMIHEEWFGIMSLGEGGDSLMRQPREAYDYLKGVWNSSSLKF